MASSSEVLRTCANLASYLKTLAPEKVAELFLHPATCLALFRWVEVPDETFPSGVGRNAALNFTNFAILT